MRLRPSNLVLLCALPAFPLALAPLFARWHWALDLLACFPAQAMTWLAVAGALLAGARRWWPAASCGVFSALAACCVLPVWLGGPAELAAAGDATPIRVLSLNLLRGNEANAAAAIAAVHDAAPDVVFCSEVTPAWLAKLDAGLAAWPHRCARADAGWYGVALYSRWPLANAAVIPLGFEWAPAVRAVVTTPAGPLGLLGVHTPRPGNRARSEQRDRALAAIANALEALPSQRVVLGDCNATPWNPAFTDALAAANLRLATHGATTWPAVFPAPLRVPIDHVLVSANVAVDATHVGRAFGSDHLPLSAVLQLRR